MSVLKVAEKKTKNPTLKSSVKIQCRYRYAIKSSDFESIMHSSHSSVAHSDSNQPPDSNFNFESICADVFYEP